jgi:hypothetical protein
MPHFTLPFQVGPGPRIDAFIAVSNARIVALQAANQPVPQSQRVLALVDTGASITSVDPSVITALGIQPTGALPVHTPSTGGTALQMNTFDVAIYIPIPNKPHFSLGALQVFESTLKVQGFEVLLGRDVLQHALFIYDGSGSFSLSF